MHIAPSGSPQPTKQAFICKLYSGFPRISSQQNLTAVYAYRKAQETKFYGKLSPNLKSFFGDVFSQDKASKPPLYIHTARRKKRSFTENSARNLSTFFGDVFSQDKENKHRRTSVLQAKFDAVFGKLSPNLSSFFGDVFSQDKVSKPPLYMQYRKAQETQFYGRNSAPNLSTFFGDVFSQDKASKPPLYMHTARRKKRSIAEKQPEKSDFHNVGFLFLCHIVNFFNVFVGYLLNFVLTVVELVFGYGFIFVELF